METLVNHYREHELTDIFYKNNPEKVSDEEERKSYSTQYTHDGYLRKWILAGDLTVCPKSKLWK